MKHGMIDYYKERTGNRRGDLIILMVFGSGIANPANRLMDFMETPMMEGFVIPPTLIAGFVIPFH